MAPAPGWIVLRWVRGVFARPEETPEAVALERNYHAAVARVREVAAEMKSGNTPTPAPRITDRVSLADVLAHEALRR